MQFFRQGCNLIKPKIVVAKNQNHKPFQKKKIVLSQHGQKSTIVALQQNKKSLKNENKQSHSLLQCKQTKLSIRDFKKNKILQNQSKIKQNKQVKNFAGNKTFNCFNNCKSQKILAYNAQLYLVPVKNMNLKVQYHNISTKNNNQSYKFSKPINNHLQTRYQTKSPKFFYTPLKNIRQQKHQVLSTTFTQFPINHFNDQVNLISSSESLQRINHFNDQVNLIASSKSLQRINPESNSKIVTKIMSNFRPWNIHNNKSYSSKDQNSLIKQTQNEIIKYQMDSQQEKKDKMVSSLKKVQFQHELFRKKYNQIQSPLSPKMAQSQVDQGNYSQQQTSSIVLYGLAERIKRINSRQLQEPKNGKTVFNQQTIKMKSTYDNDKQSRKLNSKTSFDRQLPRQSLESFTSLEADLQKAEAFTQKNEFNLYLKKNHTIFIEQY